MKWSLCALCARFHSHNWITLQYETKEGVEVKKEISLGSGRLNAFSVSTNECNLHYESDSKIQPSIITFWWIKAKNITILIIIYCISKYLSIFGFFGFFWLPFSNKFASVFSRVNLFSMPSPCALQPNKSNSYACETSWKHQFGGLERYNLKIYSRTIFFWTRIFVSFDLNGEFYWRFFLQYSTSFEMWHTKLQLNCIVSNK